MSNSEPLIRSSGGLTRSDIGPGENDNDNKLYEPDQHKTSRHKIWSIPIQTITILIIGCVGALVHLFYYRSLVDTPVDSPVRISQQWNIRIGTGLAFVTKTSWTVVILTSQVQQVWTTIENKRLRSNTIDAAFLAPTDITYLLRPDLLKVATTATLLALAAWGIPISAIITPATLTVTNHVSSRTTLSPVPAVDFADYRRWARLNAIGNFSECFNEYYQGQDCNVTENPRNTPMMVYKNYSPQVAIHVVNSASSGRVEEMTPEFTNSTYSLQFDGPSIRCRNATVRREEFKALKSNSTGELRYQAFIPAINRAGELFAWSMNGTGRLGLGLELWMVTNSVVFSKTKDMDYLVKEAHICAMYNASYSVNVTFENGRQYLDTKVETMEPMEWQNAMQVQGVVPTVEEGTNNSIPVVVNTNVQRFAYQGLWLSLMEQLLEQESIEKTRIIGAKEFRGDFQNMDDYNIRGYGGGVQPFKQNKTITEMIEQLSDNITLSLLSNDAFLKPEGTSANITVFETANIYRFDQKTLLISYGVVFAVTIASTVVGFLAYRSNGGSRSFTYSALVAAFREGRVYAEPTHIRLHQRS